MADKKKLTVEIDGDEKGLSKALGSAGDKLGDFGKKAGKALAGASIAGATAAAGIAAGLFKIGESFDDAYDKIRINTGATGAQLDGLKADFKAVLTTVPTDMGKASDAITQLVQRSGASGTALQGLSEQMLELSRITKTDLTANITSTQDAFNAWGVTVANQPGLLDEMFRASQKTGVAVGSIASEIAGAQPQLESMGFSFEKSAALAATLGQAGSSLSDVMPAMGKAMAVAAKEGKSSAKVFDDVFTKIKNAPTSTAAAGAALEVFGAKAGPKLAEMIRSGKLGYEDLLKTMQTGSDTIIGAGKDTQDFGEKWQLIKNRVLVALEPVAMRVFDAVGKAMDRVGPYVQRFAAWFNRELPVAIAYLQPKFDAFVGWLRTNLPPVLAALRTAAVATFGWLQQHVPPVFAVIKQAAQVAFDWLKVNVPPTWDKIRAAAQAAADWLSTNVPPAWAKIRVAIAEVVAWIKVNVPPILDRLQTMFESAFTAVSAIVQTAVKIVVDLWDRFGATVIDRVKGIADGLRQQFEGVIKIVTGVFDLISAILTGKWGKAWDAVKEIFNGAWEVINGLFDQAIAEFQLAWGVFTGALSAAWSLAWNGIKTFLSDIWDQIGGVVEVAGRVVLGILTGGLSELVIAVHNHWDDIVGFIGGIPGKIADAASGLWDGITSGAQGAANMVIDAVNAIIGAIDSFQIHESGVHQSIFGKTVTIVPAFDWDGFNIPKLGHFGGDSSPAYAGAREFGGPVTAGKAYLVGEKRPELFVPNTNGTIAPHVPAGGTTVVHQTNVYRVGERELARFLRTIIKREDGFGGVGA